MALPYPTKVILPFDIATAQDMNERHANDVALAAGTGLDDGAIGPDKVNTALFNLPDVGLWKVELKTNGKKVYRRSVSSTPGSIAAGALYDIVLMPYPTGITSSNISDYFVVPSILPISGVNAARFTCGVRAQVDGLQLSMSNVWSSSANPGTTIGYLKIEEV